MHAADKRIRGRKLQQIRERHFQLHPLCVRCEKEGRTEIATELDHIRALCNGGQDVESNRAGLCGPCHKAKTAEDMGYTYRPKVRIGADGYPQEDGADGRRGERLATGSAVRRA